MRPNRLRPFIPLPLIFIVSFFSLPQRCAAWGMLGHRIVGEIASTYLTTNASREIKKILGHETMAIASNWADFIKSDTSYRYLNEWHYVDVDKGLKHQEMSAVLQKDTAADAYTRLNFLIKQLKNKKLPQSQKRMY